MNDYTLLVLTYNVPGVLHRISSIFTRRKVNIENLHVSETKMIGMSRFTIVVKSDKELVEKIVSQIRKIIEVKEVLLHTTEELIHREVALIKVAVKQQDHQKLEDKSIQLDAKFTVVNDNEVTLEKCSTSDEITKMYKELSDYKIVEFIRSGRVALLF